MSPLLGAVLVTKLLILVRVVMVVVASGPLLATTIACMLSVCNWVKCLWTLRPTMLDKVTMLSIALFLVIISGAVLLCVIRLMTVPRFVGMMLFRLMT